MILGISITLCRAKREETILTTDHLRAYTRHNDYDLLTVSLLTNRTDLCYKQLSELPSSLWLTEEVRF